MIRAQGEQGGREEAARRGGERGQPDLPHHLAPLRLDVGLGELDLGENPGRVIGEQPPRVGEPDPAAVLGEQLLPDLALQLGHLLRDGRCRDVQTLGGGTDRSEPGQGIQGAEALQVQHVSDTTRIVAQTLTCATRLHSSSLTA